MPLRLGTRGSELALAQAEEIVSRLKAAGFSERVELVTVRTEGDSGKGSVNPAEGSFVDAINTRVLEKELDGGIHSMKDVPVGLPDGLQMAVVPPRGSRVDCLFSRKYYTALQPGAAVGTSSPRRVAQLLRKRADLKMVPLRGNINTRIGKVESGAMDAAVLALCGLERIGYRGREGFSVHPLPLEQFVPAAGQGALALITGLDAIPPEVARKADHRPTRDEVTIERRVLEKLGAGCNSPLGVSVQALGRGFHLMAQLLSTDGSFERKLMAVIGGEGELQEKLEVFGDSKSRSILGGDRD
jgi:hydroxymethylbilane synthase